ncbi:hypothetical protein CAPTEDRAFT_199541 [Capitella teleta]|uniref:Uncharacterized protein n=1 Tax=Capitella teleta TaxID=283909 RepID=R7UUX2_CAPTE|nr:hypothetical protein CAPTEDRAFT_199541 [Capitella teleta]|eukprot:ELU07732.1 hypothetical protein CAPTEDRAFT_199541 [Capitella teleta]
MAKVLLFQNMEENIESFDDILRPCNYLTLTRVICELDQEKKQKANVLYKICTRSTNHIDPNFKFHGAIAELARMLFSLTSDVIIPFNVTSYAAELNIEIGEMALVIPALNNTEIQNILGIILKLLYVLIIFTGFHSNFLKELFSIKIKEHQTAAEEFDDLLSSVILAELLLL